MTSKNKRGFDDIKIGEDVGISPLIHTQVSHDEVVSTNAVGVEVELEGVNTRIPDMKYWIFKEDGSLRDNGIELVFRQPLGGTDVINALDELESSIIENKVEPSLSNRTSVHVHVDVREMNYKQLMKFMLLYLIFEKPLFRKCAKGRAKNSFCLSMFNAPYSILPLINLGSMIKSNNYSQYGLRNAFRTDRRYIAANVSSVSRLGSVEFRGHRGEWRKGPLLDWINMLLSLYNAALDERILIDNLFTECSTSGVFDVMERVFGYNSKKLIYEDINQDILSGIRLAQEANVGYDLELTNAPEKYLDREGNDIFIQLMKKKNPKRLKMLEKEGRVPKSPAPPKKRDGEKGSDVQRSLDGLARAARRPTARGERPRHHAARVEQTESVRVREPSTMDVTSTWNTGGGFSGTIETGEQGGITLQETEPENLLQELDITEGLAIDDVSTEEIETRNSRPFSRDELMRAFSGMSGAQREIFNQTFPDETGEDGETAVNEDE